MSDKRPGVWIPVSERRPGPGDYPSGLWDAKVFAVLEVAKIPHQPDTQSLYDDLAAASKNPRPEIAWASCVNGNWMFWGVFEGLAEYARHTLWMPIPEFQKNRE